MLIDPSTEPLFQDAEVDYAADTVKLFHSRLKEGHIVMTVHMGALVFVVQDTVSRTELYPAGAGN